MKHSDNFTVGVPDTSCTAGLTTWLEMKFLDPGETPRSRVHRRKDRVQFMTMLSLSVKGRAFYVIAEPSDMYGIYSPGCFTRPYYSLNARFVGRDWPHSLHVQVCLGPVMVEGLTNFAPLLDVIKLSFTTFPLCVPPNLSEIPK